jgi:murein DD-endopeptidase MepM/ murein hydrolase activator NlpD
MIIKIEEISMKRKNLAFVFIAVLILAFSACSLAPGNDSELSSSLPPHSTPLVTAVPTPTLVPIPLDLTTLQNESLTPTPDPPHDTPSYLTETIYYTVQQGDSLGTIADEFDVTISFIANSNGLYNWNWVAVGQELVLPAPDSGSISPDFKIIPDSELVNGPRSINLDCTAIADSYGGYLTYYAEMVDGKLRTGPEIVEYIAALYSVNPRLLLAVLEYQSGWLTQGSSVITQFEYPAGNIDPLRVGLFYQLSWVANNLNNGYYLWKEGLIAGVTTQDNIFIPASTTINAGTFAVQYLFSKLYSQYKWRKVVTEDGFFATYEELFGYPFAWSYEPLIPADLEQPPLQLPFEEGVVWNFTGGPHNGWDSGSAWAALDFAPPMLYNGCYTSYEWVVAVADGFITHSEAGAVIQEIDGDGYPEIGWTIVYMHIYYDERVEVGQYVKAGERIGHPSCEGGLSTGTHLHIARRYNGEWILAAGDVPFVMDGWKSIGTGNIYDGYLKNNGTVIEACECRDPINTIQK